MKLKLLVFFLFFFQLSRSQTDSLSYYYQKGDYNKSLNFGEKIFNYYEYNNIKKDLNFVICLSWLVDLTDKVNDASKKEKYIHLLDENMDLFEKIDQNMINHYIILGEYYKKVGKYILAQEKYLKAIQLTEELRKIDENYFYYLQKLGQIYLEEKHFFFPNDETLKLFNKQVLVSKKIFSKDSYEYAFSLNNLGLFHEFRDDKIEAEKYFLQSLKIIENHKGNQDENYFGVLDNLSKFYLNSNNISNAEFYNQKGIDLIINKYGKENKEYLSFLSNKAHIKTELGDFDYALRLYDECIVLAENIHGLNSLYYGTMISNSASIYYFKKEYITAEKLYTIDYNIRLKIYGENHFETAICLSDLANVFSSLKEDEKAIKYYLNALIIIENTIGIENNIYARICSSIGTQYSLTNDLQNAEKYYLKSYNIKKKLNGKLNISNNVILSNIIVYYKKIKNSVNHKKYLLEYLELLKYNLIKMNSIFGQNELLNYINKLLPNNSYISISNSHLEQYSEINIAIYENQLLIKNLSLRNQQRIKNTIKKNGDANLKEKYQQFLDNKRYITKIEELPVAQRPATYDQLKIETESLEKELTRLSSTFSDAKNSLAVSWKQIQEKLKPNEVVLDLVSFNYYNTKWTDSIMYGAFLIKKDSKFPKFINLFEEKQLSVLLNRNNKAHDSIQSKIINKQYSDKEISDLFYKPLEAELKNGNTIYLAPSGLAHQINFKVLPINDNQTLGEKFKVILLGTTTALIDYKPTAFNKTNDFEMILYGGIDYNKKEVEVNKETYPNVLSDLATRSGITEFNYLPGTNEEVNKINKEAISYNLKTTIKTERAATEESVKQLSGKANPFILHLATHGYFFENIKQELSDIDKNITERNKRSIYSVSEDPMMRSGLLLAGANNSWGKSNNETNTDDGILTAKEIANLDLGNCKLVVLSACETGLGQINGSEGVFGLQRAFKMAGVQNIIMSLWKVPDAQTAELFEIFYTECFNGKSITDAFQLAQSKMKAKYPPYFWAGFVLLE